MQRMVFAAASLIKIAHIEKSISPLRLKILAAPGPFAPAALGLFALPNVRSFCFQPRAMANARNLAVVEQICQARDRIVPAVRPRRGSSARSRRRHSVPSRILIEK
jgi:hypothetical protein